MTSKILKRINPYVPYLVFIIAVYLLLSYQIQTKTTIIVGDGYFHFSRIYDVAEQIRHHSFNYFQTNWGFDQSGRVINAVYGPFFAYLMGGILLITGSWFRFQILTAFVISIIAVSGMYKVLDKIKPNLVINTLLALVYLFKISTWNNGPTFSAVSYALLPFVVLCAIRMIQNKERPVSWLQLGLTMSVVGQIHLMSTVLSALMLIPFAVVGFIQTKNRKKMVINLLVALGLTLLLTANIWLGVGYFKVVDPLGNPIATNMAESTINFSAFSFVFNLFMVFQLIYVVFNFKESKLNMTLTLTALVFILMGSSLMPWGWIQNAFPTLRETFQIPRRLFTIALPLIVAGSTISIQNLLQKRINWRYFVGALVLTTVFANFNSSIRDNSFYAINSFMNKPVQKMAFSYPIGDLFKYINRPAPDYLPRHDKIPTQDKVALYQKDVINHKNEYRHQVLKDGSLRLTWQANNPGKVKLPIVMYRYSKLTVNKKDSFILKNAIGIPTIKEQKGFNQAILSYQAPKWWTPMLIIVGISWVMTIIYSLYLAIKKLR
ncbi:hypothetical protein [Lactobacillus hominis]|uniref:Cell division protein n=1 Tax=Lactobacillus hominis DSM 23910 = CRBIP 24.179 TaxID=1423758 RepID=I7JUH7_9LACO|nr:hypothetical protein [Lactobacillus hominis]MCT3347696.1 hypothetical protein [Lactobacillus hominis]CCI81361.1 Putative uncharacterized protein [Lactobacillus hominis DSM 23910 = CRBIP 24.179]